jgi:hypothetical protein
MAPSDHRYTPRSVRAESSRALDAYQLLGYRARVLHARGMPRIGLQPWTRSDLGLTGGSTFSLSTTQWSSTFSHISGLRVTKSRTQCLLRHQRQFSGATSGSTHIALDSTDISRSRNRYAVTATRTKFTLGAAYRIERTTDSRESEAEGRCHPVELAIEPAPVQHVVRLWTRFATSPSCRRNKYKIRARGRTQRA